MPIGLGRVSSILRPMRVAAEQTHRGEINEIEMQPHQLGEGGFGAFLDVSPEEFSISAHDVRPLSPAERKTEQGFLVAGQPGLWTRYIPASHTCRLCKGRLHEPNPVACEK
jgi:hypothetical protein